LYISLNNGDGLISVVGKNIDDAAHRHALLQLHPDVCPGGIERRNEVCGNVEDNRTVMIEDGAEMGWCRAQCSIPRLTMLLMKTAPLTLSLLDYTRFVRKRTKNFYPKGLVDGSPETRADRTRLWDGRGSSECRHSQSNCDAESPTACQRMQSKACRTLRQSACSDVRFSVGGVTVT
jgi:hypothetical protein